MLFFSLNCKHRQSRIKRGWAKAINVKKVAFRKTLQIGFSNEERSL
jgi:hypothetical protein